MPRDLGVTVDPETKSKKHLIEFSLKGYVKATNVYVVGDFSCWFPGAYPMKLEGETWRLTLPFYPGEYLYAFMIEGYKWISDPKNPLKTRNAYGRECSVLQVSKSLLDAKCFGGDGKIVLEGLYHDQTPIFLDVDDKLAHIKFRAKRNDITRATLIIADRKGGTKKKEKMQKFWQNKFFEYYEATIAVPKRRGAQYFFEVEDKGTLAYYSASGASLQREQVTGFELDNTYSQSFRVPEWVRNAVFYQIFPERFYNGDKGNDPPGVCRWGEKPTRRNFFGGDLKGIIDKLDYIASLGVDALYLTPVFCSKTNHKYDVQDYFNIDPHFGDNETLKLLVKEARRKGIRIVLDAVFNHSSDDFWAFRDVREKGRNSAYKDWYFIRKFPVRKRRFLEKLLRFLPLPPKWRFRLMMKFPPSYETFAGVSFMPKLNMLNPETAEYFMRVAEYWIEEADIDGWRFDVAFGVPLEFWKKLRKRLKALKPEVYMLAEFGNHNSDPSMWVGEAFDAIMNYGLRQAILDFVVFERIRAEEFHERLMRFKALLPRKSLFVMYNLLGSHDTPRILTLCKGDINKVKLAVFLQMTLPGAPAIYYGDEIGLEGGGDPDCRRTMPWNPKDWNNEILEYHKKLIQIRKQNKALTHGEFEAILIDNEKNVYAFKRIYEDHEALALINNGDQEFLFTVKTEKQFNDALTNEPFKPKKGKVIVKLKPKEAVLLLPITRIISDKT